MKRRKFLQNAKMRDLELKERSSRSLLANVLDLEDDFRFVRPNQTRNYETLISSNGACNTAFRTALPKNELSEILKELKTLTSKIKKDEEFEEEENDWKFAAMVIDRLCLWMFTLFTIGSTFAILFSAPNFF